MARILIIDDDEGMSYTLSRVVQEQGHEAHQAHDLATGLEAIRNRAFDVVFLDVRLPDGSGLEAIPEIRAVPSRPEVIIITGFGDEQGAEIAFKLDAWDYVEKPASLPELILTLNRALQYRQEKALSVEYLVLKRDRIVGSSPLIETTLQGVGEAARSEASVLISGGTGTGKELFARAIHENSPRARERFVVIDCASLPETLVESLLFGHVRGAYTGADRPGEGLIKEADGGTLFLDEIGELPLAVQKSFLRVLQERSFRAVGGSREIFSDFRLVSATNRNLDELVAAGRFRDDLLYRLRSLQIELPLLKDRTEDIRELTIHWLTRLSERYGTGAKGYTPEFLEALRGYDWPGNVRELINVLERAMIKVGTGPTLYPKHLPPEIRTSSVKVLAEPGGPDPQEPVPDWPGAEPLPTLKAFREEVVARTEKKYLIRVLKEAAGNVAEASRTAGISQGRFYSLIKKYGLKKSY